MTTIASRQAGTRRLFTVSEYRRMAEAGILHEDDRIELLDGEILRMAAIGGRHAACVNRSAKLLIKTFDDRAIVSIQNPVRLSSTSEPEPDLMLLRPHDDEYENELPDPDDVLLILEISDSTLGYDRDKKIPLYAAAGILEVWIADLEQRRVLVYREPTGDMYREALIVEQGSLAPRAFPDLRIELMDIFGRKA